MSSRASKFLSLSLALVMTLSLCGGALAAETSEAAYPADLDASAWYYDAAVYVLDNGIMNGTDAGFEASAHVTRATVYQVLYNLEGAPAVESSAVTDVDGHWYADAINWAAQAGLFTGTAFGGDAVITRAGIADIIASYAAYKGILVDTSGMAMQEAPDYASIPADSLEGMTFCYYGKVMTGDQKGNLNPNGQLTRAEFAQVLKNFSVLKPTYVETVVSIPVAAQDGIPAHEIPATLTLPVSASKDAKVPGVVMLHGTGSNRHGLRPGRPPYGRRRHRNPAHRLHGKRRLHRQLPGLQLHLRRH